MKKLAIPLLAILVLSIPGYFTNAQAGGFIPADICFLIDTSASMVDDINQVKARINDFNTAMVNAGIDAQYCLVEFGGTSPNGATSGTAVLFQDVTTFAVFLAGPFASTTASGGGNEPGSFATVRALQDANFRSGSVINIILLTDEDDDSSPANFNLANTELTNKNALFNFIGVPGVGNTDARYGVLASNHGGSAFSIVAFRANPGPFFTNFIDVKVQEIMKMADRGPAVGGEISQLNNVALLVAGFSSSALWMAPLLVGSTGAAIIYIKKKRN